MKDIFKGYKVIELATVLAGPHVGMFFAELGAKVIKVEHPVKKDVTRSWKLGNEDDETEVSAYFSSVNYRKEYVTADLTTDEGKGFLYKLLKDADILVLNFKKGSAEKLGLSELILRKKFPQLIIGQISGFGSESNRVAYDLILQAETGFMSMNGTQTSGPVKMPVALIDVLAAHQMKEALLIALLQNNKTNEGIYIEVSLYEAAVASLMNQATNWLMAEHLPARIGSLHPNIAPYGEIFETKDKKMVTFAVGSQKQFKGLCSLLKTEELINDAKYCNNQKRIENRDDLFRILKERVSKFNLVELKIGCESAKIPFGEIKSIKQVFEDPEALSLVVEEIIGSSATKRVKSFIARFSTE